jgi:Domain of unknown function (DUF4159)
MRKSIHFIWIAVGLTLFSYAFTTNYNTAYSIRLGRLKYNGGGDWYSSRTALKNLAGFCNSNLGMSIDPEEAQVEVGSAAIFNYPYLFLTGHGNLTFSNEEANNLRTYLQGGGFLHICDNYGLNPYVRPEMKKVFPELDFVEIPFDHAIYHQTYSFNAGLPKVHEHDGKPPKGYGLILNGRIVCFYDFECDLGNGWEDREVYNDPEQIRTKALQMGANILEYTFNQ